MMKKIYEWTTNLFRYIYILLVAVWLCSRLYIMRQSLFGKTVLIQVAFSLIVPFLYAILTGLFLKGKRIGKLRPAGAQRNGRMTLILGILAGVLVLFCGIMIHRQPVFLPRTTGEILNWINGRMMALGMRPGTFFIFAIPFAACLTQRKLGKVSDLRALFLLISADAFGVAALLSGYTKVCSYGFFVFSLLFALQYVRICYREAYGDAIFRAPKQKEKLQWIKAGKRKKGRSGTARGKKQPVRRKRSGKKLSAPQPLREFGNKKSRRDTGAERKTDWPVEEQKAPEQETGMEDELINIEQMLELEAEKTREEILSDFDRENSEKKK